MLLAGNDTTTGAVLLAGNDTTDDAVLRAGATGTGRGEKGDVHFADGLRAGELDDFSGCGEFLVGSLR
jgi:hypothetical protein